MKSLFVLAEFLAARWGGVHGVAGIRVFSARAGAVARVISVRGSDHQ